ncbi:lipoprotein insertase outer membrane protein LolB [Psychrobacter sp. I-STPA6b]|uniref:lipoprotein insertase outer membrane protein LolB n=1 Tax=Psychrobacter sp. I-STPA6b TaxID=2585718 RepID=UPI001D0C8691|nr:lipoprotein insertase outer membrane protein LolB [Psychrobacter sp. I-STPA6b]
MYDITHKNIHQRYASLIQPILKHSRLVITASMFGLLGLTGCQTTTGLHQPTATSTLADSKTPSRLQAFSIRGKIGIIVPQNTQNNAQSGSAFYVWAQDGDRFTIDLTGALGIGHTVIEYNGQTATLINEQAGTITANSPEELLQQATGWQAPISQLPYWISGRPTPSDSDLDFNNQNQLTSATNGDWVASFEYPNSNTPNTTLPNRITVKKQDGHKVVMTITHSEPDFQTANEPTSTQENSIPDTANTDISGDDE